MKNNTLRVPGATLYFKVRGTGPVLLVLPGGDGDADSSDGLAGHLIDRYTVLAYDRRGLSRSAIDENAAALTIETHREDAHRLLAALTSEPVFVLGNSIGALVGLDLVARHPEQVKMLVAHEPPATQLLPTDERVSTVRAQEEVEQIYRQEGLVATMRKFIALTGLDFDDREPDVDIPSPSANRAANLAFFLEHDAPAAHLYALDLDTLQVARTQIVPAAGRSSRAIWTYRCTAALANRLGTSLAEFPGGHSGHVLRPRAFAARLDDLLRSQQRAPIVSPDVGRSEGDPL